jgi:hypothetical protein
VFDGVKCQHKETEVKKTNRFVSRCSRQGYSNLRLASSCFSSHRRLAMGGLKIFFFPLGKHSEGLIICVAQWHLWRRYSEWRSIGGILSE